MDILATYNQTAEILRVFLEVTRTTNLAMYWFVVVRFLRSIVFLLIFFRQQDQKDSGAMGLPTPRLIGAKRCIARRESDAEHESDHPCCCSKSAAAHMFSLSAVSVVQAKLKHYHGKRPHKGRESELFARLAVTKKSRIADAIAFSLREVRYRKRLGGLLKHYERVAA